MPDQTTADDAPTDGEKTPPTQTALEEAWVELFATVWRDVEWEQYDRSRTSRTEIFGEKLLTAAKQPSPEQAIDELCRRFGLAASTLSTESFGTLRAAPDQAIDVLRNNRVYLAAETRQTIDAYYDALEEDEGDSDQEADPDAQATDLGDFVAVDSSSDSTTESENNA